MRARGKAVDLRARLAGVPSISKSISESYRISAALPGVGVFVLALPFASLGFLL